MDAALAGPRHPARGAGGPGDGLGPEAGQRGGFSVDYSTPGSQSKAATLEGIADPPKAAEAGVSPDGQIAITHLQLTERAPDVPKATGEELLDMRDEIRAQGVKLELGGEVIQTAQQGPISSEAVGLTIAAIILLISLGTVVAAGLPLILALFGLGIATSLIGVLAAVIDTPDWSVTLAAMLGIGVGIDYALLMLTRHRAALQNGASVHDAVAEAVSTAGRSVLIAGTTVVISLLGLFAMGPPTSMASRSRRSSPCSW